MIKYLGMYLLMGFLIQFGTIIAISIWSGAKLGWDSKRSDDARDYLIKLKIQLYGEEANNAAIDAYRNFMRNMNANQSLAYYGISFALWPMALAENIQIMPDYVRYINEKSSSQ